jgi:hypothetical protein
MTRKSWRFAAPKLAILTVALALALFQARAHAATVVSVGGAADTGINIGADEAAAVAFSLDADLRNVTIEANANCVLTCVGGIFLQQDFLGPSAVFSQTLVGQSFPSAPGISLPFLAAGRYFLVIDIDTGDAAWLGSSAPDIVSNGGSFDGVLFADPADTFAPRSNFDFLFDTDLQFTVTGDTTDAPPVPLPPAGWMLIAGLGVLVAIRRRGRV